MVKRGKRYTAASSQITENKSHEPVEAIALVKKIPSAKFDETVELHLKTGADPRQADQLIRGVAMLPYGLGKTVRVLVFAQGDTVRTATDAGADYAGGDDLIEKIEGGWVDFDTSIATPDMMAKVGRLGKILGRRGLMPNPRTGTVVQPSDISKAVEDAKKGRVEFRMDRTSIIHTSIGKSSFQEEALLQNLASLLETIVRAKPATIKGQFLRSAYLTTTMGPSISLDLPSLLELKVE